MISFFPFSKSMLQAVNVISDFAEAFKKEETTPLNRDVIAEIFKNLTELKDIQSAMLVCRAWNTALTDRELTDILVRCLFSEKRIILNIDSRIASSKSVKCSLRNNSLYFFSRKDNISNFFQVSLNDYKTKLLQSPVPFQNVHFMKDGFVANSYTEDYSISYNEIGFVPFSDSKIDLAKQFYSTTNAWGATLATNKNDTYAIYRSPGEILVFSKDNKDVKFSIDFDYELVVNDDLSIKQSELNCIDMHLYNNLLIGLFQAGGRSSFKPKGYYEVIYVIIYDLNLKDGHANLKLREPIHIKCLMPFFQVKQKAPNQNPFKSKFLSANNNLLGIRGKNEIILFDLTTFTRRKSLPLDEPNSPCFFKIHENAIAIQQNNNLKIVRRDDFEVMQDWKLGRIPYKLSENYIVINHLFSDYVLNVITGDIITEVNKVVSVNNTFCKLKAPHIMHFGELRAVRNSGFLLCKKDDNTYFVNSSAIKSKIIFLRHSMNNVTSSVSKVFTNISEISEAILGISYDIIDLTWARLRGQPWP